jgi:hypothetical protein
VRPRVIRGGAKKHEKSWEKMEFSKQMMNF